MFLTSKNEYKINIPPFLVFQAITYCLIGKHVYSWECSHENFLLYIQIKARPCRGCSS